MLNDFVAEFVQKNEGENDSTENRTSLIVCKQDENVLVVSFKTRSEIQNDPMAHVFRDGTSVGDFIESLLPHLHEVPVELRDDVVRGLVPNSVCIERIRDDISITSMYGLNVNINAKPLTSFKRSSIMSSIPCPLFFLYDQTILF
jgi:hypothetical protein